MASMSKTMTGLLMIALLGLPACAVQHASADRNDPEAALKRSSYRVVLVNQTSVPIHFRYTRYLPQEGQQTRPMPIDPNDSRKVNTLNISFTFDELKPGATAILDVIPGSGLSVNYQVKGEQHSEDKTLDAPMQLNISESGLNQE